MTSPSEPYEVDPRELLELVDSCAELCERARAAVQHVSPNSGSFLGRNLLDAMQQLELILRVFERDERRAAKERGTGGFLKRIARGLTGAREGERDDDDMESLDASQQGLQGNSWTISLSELLGFLAFGHKTGVLWIDTPDENFMIGMTDGNVSYASSDRTPDGLRLGEVLVRRGMLTRKQLRRFLDWHGQEKQGLSGEALLATGLINDNDLRGALAAQIQELFHRIIATKNAVYRFRDGMQVMVAYPVCLNVTSLLLESARFHDEVSQAEEARAQAREARRLKRAQGPQHVEAPPQLGESQQQVRLSGAMQDRLTATPQHHHQSQAPRPTPGGSADDWSNFNQAFLDELSSLVKQRYGVGERPSPQQLLDAAASAAGVSRSRPAEPPAALPAGPAADEPVAEEAPAAALPAEPEEADGADDPGDAEEPEEAKKAASRSRKPSKAQEESDEEASAGTSKRRTKKRGKG